MFSGFWFACCVPVRVVAVQLQLNLFGCDGRIQLRVCFVPFSGVSLCEDREEDLDLTHECCCVSFSDSMISSVARRRHKPQNAHVLHALE